MKLISCKNVVMGYEGVAVTPEITFNIEDSDNICIIGENGSGKTTLVKGLLNLVTPKSGSIVYGEELKKNQIGYLPQQTQIQKNFPASVYEVVLSGCLNSTGRFPFYNKKIKKTAQKNMEKCKIVDIKNMCYGELSGGQQQKVLLARALCSAKKLLIMDEPVTGLDPLAANEMYDIISDLNGSGMTIVMITHDVNTAISRSKKILHIESDGYFFGTSHQYVHSEMGKRFIFTGCNCDRCERNIKAN